MKRITALIFAFILLLPVVGWAGWTCPVNPRGTASPYNLTNKGVITFNDSDWQTCDVSTIVPSGTKALILSVRNTGGTVYKANVRYKGSSSTRNPLVGLGRQTVLYVGLDSNRQFETFFNNSALDVVILAYSDEDANDTAGADLSIGTTGSWTLSPAFSNATASTIAFAEIYSTSSSFVAGVRGGGDSTLDTYATVAPDGSPCGQLGIAEMDGDKKISEKIQSTSVDMYGWGWTANGSWLGDSALDGGTLTASAWTTYTCSGAPGNAVAAIVWVKNGASNYHMNFRKYGSTDNVTTSCTTRVNGAFTTVVGLSTDAKFQYYVTNSAVTFKVLGYLTGTAPSHQSSWYLSNAGSDLDPGTEANPIATIGYLLAVHEFAPGDTIYFNKGDTFRQQLKMTGSGSSGSPITITSYGSGNAPIISGYENKLGTPGSSWTNEGSNVWSIPFTGLAGQTCTTAKFNGTLGTRCYTPAYLDGSESNMYASDASKFYVYCTSDPASYYSSIEIGWRPHCIDTYGYDYLNITGLVCEGNGKADEADQNIYTGAIRVYIGSDTINITNCETRYSWAHGLKVLGASNVTITNHNGHDSVGNNFNGDAMLIQRNPSTDLGSYYVTVSGGTFAKGSSLYYDGSTVTDSRNPISIVGLNTGTISGVTITGSVAIEPTQDLAEVVNVTFTGNTISGSIGAGPLGTYSQIKKLILTNNTISGISFARFDRDQTYTPGSLTDATVISGNTMGWMSLLGTAATIVDGNFITTTAASPAVQIQVGQNGEPLWGIFRNNIVKTNQDHAMKISGTAVDSYYDLKIYNNTFFGYVTKGLYEVTSGTVTTGTWEAKNNIFYTTNFVGDGLLGMHIDKSGTVLSGSCDYNDYYPITGLGSDRFYRWNTPSSVFHTYSEFRSIDSQEPSMTGGNPGDPLFLNAGGSYALATDFKLQTGSPCINAGTNDVNAVVTTDYEGNPRPQ